MTTPHPHFPTPCRRITRGTGQVVTWEIILRAGFTYHSEIGNVSCTLYSSVKLQWGFQGLHGLSPDNPLNSLVGMEKRRISFTFCSCQFSRIERWEDWIEFVFMEIVVELCVPATLGLVVATPTPSLAIWTVPWGPPAVSPTPSKLRILSWRFCGQ